MTVKAAIFARINHNAKVRQETVYGILFIRSVAVSYL